MCDKCGCGHSHEHTEQEVSLQEQVVEILDTIREGLQGHGGDVEFVSLDDNNVVSVRLQGACRGCPGATMTMKMGIERILKERLPQISKVVAVS